MARPVSSRRKFGEYLEDLRRRTAAGETGSDASPHGTSSHGAGSSKSNQPTAPGQPKVLGDRAVPRQRSFFLLLRKFLGLVSAHWATLALILGGLSLATFLKLFPPAATKLTIDYVLTERPLPEALTLWLPAGVGKPELLVALAGGVVLVSLLGTLLAVWTRWQATWISKQVQVSVRQRAFAHAVRLPLQRVYQLKTGGATSLLREDAGGVSDLIFSLLYNPWRALIQLAGSLLVLAWVDWRLLIGALLLVPAIYYTHRTWIGQIRPIHRDIRKQRQEVDSQTTEAFGGMRVVRAFGRQRSESARFVRGNHLMARQELLAWWRTRLIEILWDVLIPFASAALLVYGGREVLAGRLTLGDLMMFLFYLAMLLEPLAVLANSATQLQTNLAGLDRVLDLLDDPLEMPSPPGALQVTKPETAGQITFSGVSFHYPGSQEDVLRDINLEVPAGHTLALVGPSGAGKTTLCNLVARFYDPTAGRVLLDGVDLREINVESYRQLFGIVEQDIFLFDGTIADNIGYANRHATREEIRAAAQAANADEFIRQLPQGYDTLIGERGVRLSGGQRQRLPIARAILADPRILILDEATSNLDTESERLIQEGLELLMKGRTCFVIAHRLSTVTHADGIVVFDHGQIVEQGTHADLLQRNGRYARMVALQHASTETPLSFRGLLPPDELEPAYPKPR